MDVSAIRQQFPALSRRVGNQPAVFFDGPAGSQTPQCVIDAVAGYLRNANANHGGVFATSVESDLLLAAAHQGLADFVGADDPACVVFGANMTTLTFAFSRAMARSWRPGDEVVVTQLDHDANVTPWVLAARDAGAVVRQVCLRREDCTLDLEDFQRQLSPRTRLVALGCASNGVGSKNPIETLVAAAHAVGAEVFLDAVHYAPHLLPDVAAWKCDYLVCSAYKFFGPHLGVLWGRRDRLAELPAYKVRPAPDDLPGRWMTGTGSHEAIAGSLAAVDYLAELGRTLEPSAHRRRARLVAAYESIAQYETGLLQRLMAGLAALPRLKVWGVVDPARFSERVPTVSFTHERHAPRAVAEFLAARGIFVWHGNYYALSLTEALGLEPEGMVRVGLLHYNTAEEVDRLLEALREMDRSSN